MLTADIWKAETQSRELHVKMDDVTFRRWFLTFLEFFLHAKQIQTNSPSLKACDGCFLL